MCKKDEKTRDNEPLLAELRKSENISKIFSKIPEVMNTYSDHGKVAIKTHFRKVVVKKANEKKLTSSDFGPICRFIQDYETSYQNQEFIKKCMQIPEIKDEVIHRMLQLLCGIHLVKFLNDYDEEFCEEDQNLLIATKNRKAILTYINRYQFWPRPEANFLCELDDKLVSQYTELYTIDSVNQFTAKDNGLILSY